MTIKQQNQSLENQMLKIANDCRLALVTQVHELIDHIERASSTIIDSDMRKQLLDQAAFAGRVADRWNQNGNPFILPSDQAPDSAESFELAVYGVFGEDDTPEFMSLWSEMCHEHINDMINEEDIIDAAKWKVVALYKRKDTPEINVCKRTPRSEYGGSCADLLNQIRVPNFSNDGYGGLI